MPTSQPAAILPIAQPSETQTHRTLSARTAAGYRAGSCVKEYPGGLRTHPMTKTAAKDIMNKVWQILIRLRKLGRTKLTLLYN